MNHKYIIPYVMCLLFATQITYTQNLKEATTKIDAYHNSLASKLQTQDSKNLKEEDIANWVITSEHVSRTSGVHHIYYRQTVNGIEIYGAEASIHIASNGEVVSKNNNFMAYFSQKVKGGKSPSLTPLQAVSAAANSENYRISENLTVLDVVDFAKQEYIISKGGIANSEIPVKLMYIQNSKGEIVLTWSLAIDDIEGRNYYNFKVDAQTGEIIEEIDWQSNCGFEHVCETHHSGHDHDLEHTPMEHWWYHTTSPLLLGYYSSQ